MKRDVALFYALPRPEIPEQGLLVEKASAVLDERPQYFERFRGQRYDDVALHEPSFGDVQSESIELVQLILSAHVAALRNF